MKIMKNLMKFQNYQPVNPTITEKKILKCSASLSLVLQFDSAPEWVQCSPCDSWVYLMCEAIPDLDLEHIKHKLS